MSVELKDLQQLYIVADETRLHYAIQQQGTDDPDTARRRATSIQTNLNTLTASIQELIDYEVY